MRAVLTALVVLTLLACARVDPEQQRIEQAAVAAAQEGLPGMGVLTGQPKRVSARKMPLDEADRRIAGRARECRGAERPVWLVVLEGELDEAGLLPGQKGIDPAGESGYWMILSPDGRVERWGRARVDLSKEAPPPSTGPPCSGAG